MWRTVQKTDQSAAVPESLALELRRGALVLAALGALRAEQYGYSLKKSLAESEIHVDEGTLYPLLSRLRRERLLDYKWQESETGPPRKYYSLTAHGRKRLDDLKVYWEDINKTIKNLGK